MTGHNITAQTEQLEVRIGDLIKERDEYDKRRKDALITTETWRNRYHDLTVLLEEIITKHVAASELRDFYRCQAKGI